MAWLTAETVYLIFPIATLVLGLLIGYLAQRSGFCSIGGMRDLFLFNILDCSLDTLL